MDIEENFNFEHLFLYERKCRSCGKTKNLIESFYRTRKNRGISPSSFSYECKECTKNRIINNRKKGNIESKFEYPDW